jgi:hypothetical protein
MRRRPRQRDPIREATISAFKHVVDQLLDLMLDSGVTVKEFNHLVRDRAVRTATKRVIKECGRNSKSRVAIMTGLSRSEVSKILDSSDAAPKTPLGQHPARRVLAAWYDDPRFFADSGEPTVLPIFGRTRSFDQLVSLYGGGIPVRAMLDELTLIGAIERLPDQKVRAKSRVPILTGLTTSAIVAAGERSRDLLQTLMGNLRRPSLPLFEATALVCDAEPDMVPMVRRELAEQGASFINGANSFLKRSRSKPGAVAVKSASKCRVGVSVYYFEEQMGDSGLNGEVRQGGRKNLRRQRSAKLRT